MRLTRRKFLAGVAAGALGGCAFAQNGEKAELILCGAEEVFILEVSGGKEVEWRKIWSWRAADSPEIPEAMRRSFRSTDDCKPVEGGKKILISSSQGAVALVERASKRALFHAAVINAHSVELLPGGRIAAASSVKEDPKANRVIIFDAATREELASDRLVAAHGLVWDEARELLWALGGTELRAYRVGGLGLGESPRASLGTAPETRSVGLGDSPRASLGTVPETRTVPGGKLEMKLEYQMNLPDESGHDLNGLPGGRDLFISTGHRCWVFNRETRKMEPHEVLGSMENIKSYSVHKGSGRIAWLQAETNWWTDDVHMMKPEGVLTLKGERLYKARWNG